MALFFAPLLGAWSVRDRRVLACLTLVRSLIAGSLTIDEYHHWCVSVDVDEHLAR
jgi:hypothetical protein